MKRGTVKFFNQTKGYGFIIQEDNSELFFHVNDVKGEPKQLRDGVIVTYELGSNKKGQIATNVDLE